MEAKRPVTGYGNRGLEGARRTGVERDGGDTITSTRRVPWYAGQRRLGSGGRREGERSCCYGRAFIGRNIQLVM